MLNELYRAPAGEETGAALAFLSRGIAGAEAYVFLYLNRERLPEGRLFCAFRDGGIESVVFHNGERFVETAAGVDPYPGLRLMRFAGPRRAVGGPAVPLALPDTLEAYRILGGGTLSPENEARYVYRARAMREGLAAGFGVKEDGALRAFAFIVAQNENSVLIGDVFTRPAYRGRGYASAAVTACAAAARGDAFILCEEKNAGFYKKLGFGEAAE